MGDSFCDHSFECGFWRNARVRAGSRNYRKLLPGFEFSRTPKVHFSAMHVDDEIPLALLDCGGRLARNTAERHSIAVSLGLVALGRNVEITQDLLS